VKPGPLPLCLAVLLPIALAGCIPIPLADAPPYESETVMSLGPGSTRADVLLGLGAPNFVHDNERIFVYASDEDLMAYVFLLGNGYAGAAGGGTIARRHLLIVEFFADGGVARLEQLDLGAGTPAERGMEIGFDEFVCTSWGLCLGQSGAVLGGEQPDPLPQNQPTR